MRVALALHRWFPFGGMQRDMVLTARALQAAGHSVCVFTQRWEGARLDDLEVQCIEVRATTNHGRAAEFSRQLPARTRSWGADRVLGFDKIEQLDLYFAADPCFLAHGHDERGFWYRLTPRFRVFSELERGVFDHGLRTRILLIDPRQEAVYRQWHGTEAERFIHLPPGVDPSRMAGSDATERRRSTRASLGITDETHLLLFIGSDFHRKGLDRVVRGLAALPEPLSAQTRLLAVGQDDPNPTRRLARQLGLADRVDLRAGSDAVPDLLQAADLLVHPARRENTGTVLVEALAAGLPVLCSAACGHAMHVDAAGAGEVLPEPHDETAFANALQRLLSADAGGLRARALGWASATDLTSMHAAIVRAVEACPGREHAP